MNINNLLNYKFKAYTKNVNKYKIQFCPSYYYGYNYKKLCLQKLIYYFTLYYIN